MIIFSLSLLSIIFIVGILVWLGWLKAPRKRRLFYALHLSFIIGISSVLYYFSGTFSQSLELNHQAQDKETIKQHIAYYRTHPEDLTQKLEAQLKKQPNSARGWLLLGMMYDSQGHYQQSTEAYLKARDLEPTNHLATLRFIEANALLHGGAWQESDRASVLPLINEEDSAVNALNILAAMDYQKSDFQNAILDWQRVLKKLENDEEKTSVKEAIAQAQAKLQPSVESVITVNVDIAPALRKKYPPNTTVLIYAKANQGPPMPLAVVKRQLKDLPLRIRLTEGDAMIPGMSLSHFKNIIVYARISQHGQAMPQKGDAIAQKKFTQKGKGQSLDLLIQKTVV